MEQTDSCTNGGGRENGERKEKGLVKEHVWLAHGHRQWRADWLGESVGLGGGGQKRKKILGQL